MNPFSTFNTYYGGFRTRTFAEIFPDLETFKEYYDTVPIQHLLTSEDTLTNIYYLLYAKYGNSHIAMSDENQFIFAVMSTIFMYGPSWEKRLEVQYKLRTMTDEQLLLGGRAIYNHSFNPSTAPSTDTLEELTTINEQNTTNYKKSRLESYANLITLLETDVTEEFIGKFKKLFLTIVAADYPLLYESTITEEEI